MAFPTHSARVLEPLPYQATGGARHSIPVGPCLVEQMDNRLIDIIWGARGQSSTALPLEQVEAARKNGHLVLLD